MAVTVFIFKISTITKSTMTTILSQIPSIRKEIYHLLVSLKKQISCDTIIETGDGDVQGLDVTIGCTFNFSDGEISWNYQTGDNSYTGGAYGHPEWFTCSLMKRSSCKEIATDLADEIRERIAELAP